MKKYADGVCPCCEAEIEYNGSYDHDDDGATLQFYCPACGARGKAGYTFVFDGYYNVVDKSGSVVKLDD